MAYVRKHERASAVVVEDSRLKLPTCSLSLSDSLCLSLNVVAFTVYGEFDTLRSVLAFAICAYHTLLSTRSFSPTRRGRSRRKKPEPITVLSALARPHFTSSSALNYYCSIYHASSRYVFAWHKNCAACSQNSRPLPHSAAS